MPEVHALYYYVSLNPILTLFAVMIGLLVFNRCYCEIYANVISLAAVIVGSFLLFFGGKGGLRSASHNG